MTVMRPLAAFVTAISAGFLENIVNRPEAEGPLRADRSCPVDNCCDGIDCPDDVHRRHHRMGEKITAGLRFAVTDVWGDIVGWFTAGLLLAAVITVIIPDELMVSWLGGGISSMLVMLVIGIPLYICASASTPIAAALILKGVSPGAALVFLLAGPATNVTSLTVLVGLLGKRGTLRYLLVLACCTVAFGLFVDWLYRFLGISAAAVIGEAAEMVPEWLRFAGVAVVLLISIKPLVALVRRKIGGSRGKTVFRSDFPALHGTGGKNGNDSPCPPSCGCGH